MKMKKLFSLLLMVSLFVSCNKTTKNSDNYIIDGTAKGVYNGIRVYLSSLDEAGNQVYQDTAIVVNEKFTFEGTVNKPSVWYLSANEVTGNFPIIIENSTFNIDLNKDDFQSTQVTGSKSNKALSDYNKGLKDMSDKRLNISKSQREALQKQDSQSVNKFEQEIIKLNEDRVNYPYTFINKNKDNFFSLVLVETLLKNKTSDFKRVIQSYNSLDDDIRSSDFGIIIYGEIVKTKEMLEQTALLSEGGIAPNFTAPDPNGKMISLNDIKGKVTIIDFWASWCGPCRRENPNVVSVYNKYHDKGLEIISVSLDKPGQKDKWLKAIEDDKLTWHHVSNLNYFNDPIAKLYNIQSIPSTFILDNEGKIVAKKLRGKALEDKVAELLN